MAKITTADGQTFETRLNHYGYYDGEPCRIIEMRGDFDTFKDNDTVLLQAQRLEDGWVRYWLSSTNPAKRYTIGAIARA